MPSLGTATTGNTPFSPQWLQAIGTLLVDLILAQVALALGNISILGVAPFAFLTQWGHDLQQSASDAYIAATNAQTSADTAQATGDTAQDTAESALALASQTAAAQAAGAHTPYTDGFGGASAANLGADYDRVADSGSGAWGLDGSGNAHSIPGGSTPQTWFDRVKSSVFTFATNKQTGSVVLSTVPHSSGGFGTVSSRIGIPLFVNAAMTSYVVGYVDFGFIEIGVWVSGTYHQITTLSVTQAPGDLWEFRADLNTGTPAFTFDMLRGNTSVFTTLPTNTSFASGFDVATGSDTGGMIARDGNVVSFGFTIQVEAPDVQILNLFDRA